MIGGPSRSNNGMRKTEETRMTLRFLANEIRKIGKWSCLILELRKCSQKAGMR